MGMPFSASMAAAAPAAAWAVGKADQAGPDELVPDTDDGGQGLVGLIRGRCAPFLQIQEEHDVPVDGVVPEAEKVLPGTRSSSSPWIMDPMVVGEQLVAMDQMVVGLMPSSMNAGGSQ